MSKRTPMSPGDRRIADMFTRVQASEIAALEAAKVRAIQAYILGLPPIRRARR